MNIINGKQIAEIIFENLKKEFFLLNFTPVVYDVLVGKDTVSLSYVNIKAKAAKRLGLVFKILNLDSKVSQEELESRISKINKEPKVCGIVLQLPLPNTLNQERALNAIFYKLDVDAMGKINMEKFYNSEPGFIPPTVSAIWEILNTLPIELSQKQFLIIGQGKLVGKPVAHFLKERGYKVKVADNSTSEIFSLSKKADIIISAAGQPKLIKKEMVRQGAIIIDAGTSESSGAIVGDADFTGISAVARFITPVPGGVGPVTVAMLYKNVAKAAKNLDRTYAR